MNDSTRSFTGGIALYAAVAALSVLSACATVGGAALGTGIGAAAGDARTGAIAGAAAGAAIDIWGR